MSSIFIQKTISRNIYILIRIKRLSNSHLTLFTQPARGTPARKLPWPRLYPISHAMFFAVVPNQTSSAQGHYIRITFQHFNERASPFIYRIYSHDERKDALSYIKGHSGGLRSLYAVKLYAGSRLLCYTYTVTLAESWRPPPSKKKERRAKRSRKFRMIFYITLFCLFLSFSLVRARARSSSHFFLLPIHSFFFFMEATVGVSRAHR